MRLLDGMHRLRALDRPALSDDRTVTARAAGLPSKDTTTRMLASIVPLGNISLCRRLGRLAAVIFAVLALPAASAAAAAPAPAWTLTSVSAPSYFAPGDSSGTAHYEITLVNTGGAATDGSPITVTDQLPAGLTLDPSGASGSSYGIGTSFGSTPLACSGGPTVACTLDGTLPPGTELQVDVPVDIAANAPASVTNAVTVSGGGAQDVSATEPTTISSTPAAFGIQQFQFSATNADGSPALQAGSHPYQITTNLHLTTTEDASGNIVPTQNFKDVDVALPAGIVGDPQATPQCSGEAFYGAGYLDEPTCPQDTQVGVVNGLFLPAGGPFLQNDIPLYNLVPGPGLAASFGFNVASETYGFLDAQVRTGGDYGITEELHDITAALGVTGASVTIWGDPADPSHDALRQGGAPTGRSVEPLLTMPTACGGPLSTTVQVDSWQNPGVTADASFTTPAITGCDALDFSPTISVQPDTTVADSPSGLAVDLQMPLAGLLDPNGLAEANLNDATVTLPQGVSVNPSAANGLAACTPQEIGIDNADPPTCPDASKIGSVEVVTPLLPDPLVGGIYFAQQTQNPFGSLLAIYLTAYADGVWIKLAGHVVPDPVTGQLTTTFSNNPQLPFTDFKLDFFGGPQGVLATPDSCGTYTTTSDLTPWSTPAVADATPSDSFSINSGCVSGFSPSFTAGTQNPQAGAYSPFVLSFQRSDTDQYLSGLSVTLPPGMLAKLAGVQECTDAQLATISSQPGTGAAQAADPSCPAGSQVGTVEAGAGPGSDPFYLPGSVYLTGPYNGAPYGLAVVVPVLAGPLDLGTVVVRQALDINPTTAQVTDVSDPFPTILDGIPLRIRSISVTLNRSGFTVNPTSCDPMSINATLSSTGGINSNLSSRFQVGGCSSLGFSPKLKMALTGKGKTRSGDHPTLTATLTQPAGQANISSTKVTLPLSMALDPKNSQHVCSYSVAQAVTTAPANCPASTIVGTAAADTPLLSQPLTGKVYLVQGIRFNKQGQQIRTLPSLLIPLRGQIALDLRAQTSVNGAKQLVTTFSTIPDAAVSRFTLTITGGKKGLLVITGRGRTICNKPQVTGATLGAQSGKTENSSIKMSTPCRKTKAHKHSKKHKKLSKK